MSEPLPQIIATLARTATFGGLPEKVLQAFAARCTLRVLHTGEMLFRERQAVRALYVVAVGRLRAYADQGALPEKALGEIPPLQCMGEIAILADQQHTATVRAVRDSVVVCLPREALMELLRLHPDALMQLSQVVVGRLLERLRRPDPGLSGPRTLALVPATPNVDVRGLGLALQRIYSRLGPVRLLDAAAVDEAMGEPIARCRFDDAEPNQRLLGWLSRQESEQPLLIYLADAEPGPWSRRCMRQADRILVVTDSGSGEARQTPMLAQLAATDVEAPTVLVLQCPQGSTAGTDPLGWRSYAAAGCHHYLRSPSDLPGLARSLIGQGVGLVLGGGGARGFAHLGLLRATRELGIPIDIIGGTSMGAFIGALHAGGLALEDITELVNETFVRRNHLNDYILPRVSLLATRKFRRRLDGIFREQRLEHLALPYFCISTSLTRGEAVVHERGLLRDWVGTSMAIPGIAPPMVWNEELLADGAVINNLPADVMRQFGRGSVIACDVSSEPALRARGVTGPDFDALLRWQGTEQRPGLFDILLRSATLSSKSDLRARAAMADCYIRMPTAGVGLFQWKALDRVAEVSYQHALAELTAFLPRLSLLARP